MGQSHRSHGRIGRTQFGEVATLAFEARSKTCGGRTQFELQSHTGTLFTGFGVNKYVSGDQE